MKNIVSIDNPLIREILNLKKSPSEKILIEGLNLVKTVLEAQKDHRVEKILLTDIFISKHRDYIKTLEGKDLELIKISEKVAYKISDTVNPQGIFALVSWKIKNLGEAKLKKFDVLVILDKVQDPGNMGTIIRTAEAFGIDALVFTTGSCNPLSSKVIRASAGSIFFISLYKANEDEIEEFINKHSIRLIITEPKAEKMIFEIDLSSPLAILFGNEAHGAGLYFKKIPHTSCRIPLLGRAESLNVAMSASIILYEIMKNRLFKLTKFVPDF